MEHYRFAGYRVIQFPDVSKAALEQIAERLIPHEQEIVANWVELQFAAWQPPGLSRDDLHDLFGGLVHNIFARMKSRDLERCIADLEVAGADLARRDFPYEALIVSLHFLEESYMPLLLNPQSEHSRKWLIRMDEFLHVAIAALATSYFRYHRNQLLAEAEVGRLVQEGLMPSIPGNILDLEVGYIYLSAREGARVGGDLLDVFTLVEHGAAFIVGDLSGHGLEAAADSVMLRALFKGFMRENPDLVDAMTRLNSVLISELDGDHFATALAGTYEPSGCVSLVSAGHPPPILFNHDNHPVQLSGLPLAVDDEAAYSLIRVDLKRGMSLVAYTDGLTEARVGTDLFGEQRVLEAIAEVHDASARAVAEHLLDEALRHAGGRLKDDVAILVLKRLGA